MAVHGHGFVQSAMLKCKFTWAVVDAAFVSSNVVNCTSPAQPAGGTVLEVSNNGVDYSISKKTFNYVVGVTITLLSPPAGPQRGGSTVSVIGIGFLRGSVCYFGAVAASAATLVTSGELLCVSPAQPVGRHAVEVTDNMQDFTNNGIDFEYVAPPMVLSLIHI